MVNPKDHVFLSKYKQIPEKFKGPLQFTKALCVVGTALIRVGKPTLLKSLGKHYPQKGPPSGRLWGHCLLGVSLAKEVPE